MGILWCITLSSLSLSMARADAGEWLCGVAGHMAKQPSRDIAQPCSAPCFDWEDNVHGASHANKNWAYVKGLVISRRNMTADGSLLSHPTTAQIFLNLLSGTSNPTRRLWVSRAAIRLFVQSADPSLSPHSRRHEHLPLLSLPIRLLADVHMSV